VNEPLRVALVGAGGRMGRFAAGLLRVSDEFQLVAELGRRDDLALALARSKATLGLDLTVAGLGAQHARLMLEAGLRPVVGTSGVRAEEVAALDRQARGRGLGGLVVPNFCLGMVRLQEIANALVGDHPRVEIVETHHAGKRDAPSGTALDTARRLEAHGASAVEIRSRRLPGAAARHEIHLASEGERLCLVHEASGVEAYGPGLRLALLYAATASGVACGLQHAL
jgi:4-hydroxy-tetrahydrodipicolinate reductase